MRDFWKEINSRETIFKPKSAEEAKNLVKM
jgi:hypothetical protein